MLLDRNMGWRAHRRLFSTAGFFEVGILWCWHSGDEERARRIQHIAGIREESQTTYRAGKVGWVGRLVSTAMSYDGRLAQRY